MENLVTASTYRTSRLFSSFFVFPLHFVVSFFSENINSKTAKPYLSMFVLLIAVADAVHGLPNISSAGL